MKFVLVFLFYFVSSLAAQDKVSNPRIVVGQLARIGSLNPYSLSGIDSFTVTGYVIEPLMRIDPYTQNLEPCLATGWKILEKEKTIRVTLRKGVKFHDGQEFTAEDVRFTLKSYFDPAYKGEIWRGMWDQVEDVIVIDPHTVEFKMKEMGFQQFKNVISSLRILPREFYSTVDHDKWRDHLIGTGPFKVARFESNTLLELFPNREWWGWKEYDLKLAPSLLIKTVPDLNAAELLLAKGDLNFFEIPSDANYSGELTPKEARSPFGRGMALTINLKNPHLSDVRMRKALLLLWNRQALNEKVFGGKYQLALDSYAPAMYYYPTRKPVAFDPEGAKKWLKQMGYSDSDQDSFLDKNGEKLSLKVILRGGPSERWVGLFQTDAAKLGIQVRMERISDEAQWWHVLKQGKYDLAAFDGAFSEAPHASVMHSKGAYNNSGFANAKIDRMFDGLEKEFNSQKRRKAYRQLIASIRDSAVEVPGLYTNKVYILATPDVTFDKKFPTQAWRWRKKDEQKSSEQVRQFR